jgi:hypothetical protein
MLYATLHELFFPDIVPREHVSLDKLQCAFGLLLCVGNCLCDAEDS